MRWLPRLSLGTLLRLGFALIALGMTFVLPRGSLSRTLPWILLVVTLDLAATALLASGSGHTRVGRARALALVVFTALTVGAAAAFAGPAAPLLVLIPAFHAGLRFGRWGALAIPMLAAATGLGIDLARGEGWGGDQRWVLFWALAGTIIGLLGAWSDRIEEQQQGPDPSLAAEASALLRRLHELADSLDIGFDAPASAEMALQDLAARMRATRSAVLVGYGTEPAVPLAIRGADRAPWPEPTDVGSLLWRAWQGGEATLSQWDGDTVDRSVIAVPLNDGTGQRLGLLVADRPGATPFTDDDLDEACQVAQKHAPLIDLSVVFAGLRERAALEERERLAREMHDGIAQEMVALGFGLDALRRTARVQDSPLADGLDGLRQDVSRVLADLRLHIADLRIAVRPETGLGALIGTRLQSFGSATGMTTKMHLSETGFRLPAHTEVLIYRLFLQVLGDARRGMTATTMDVALNVAAPRAELRVSHNGVSDLHQRDFEEHPLKTLGGEVTVERHGERGVTVHMRMRARGATPSATLSHERIPQPS